MLNIRQVKRCCIFLCTGMGFFLLVLMNSTFAAFTPSFNNYNNGANFNSQAPYTVQGTQVFNALTNATLPPDKISSGVISNATINPGSINSGTLNGGVTVACKTSYFSPIIASGSTGWGGDLSTVFAWGPIGPQGATSSDRSGTLCPGNYRYTVVMSIAGAKAEYDGSSLGHPGCKVYNAGWDCGSYRCGYDTSMRTSRGVVLFNDTGGIWVDQWQHKSTSYSGTYGTSDGFIMPPVVHVRNGDCVGLYADYWYANSTQQYSSISVYP